LFVLQRYFPDCLIHHDGIHCPKCGSGNSCNNKIQTKGFRDSLHTILDSEGQTFHIYTSGFVHEGCPGHDGEQQPDMLQGTHVAAPQQCYMKHALQQPMHMYVAGHPDMYMALQARTSPSGMMTWKQ